MRNTLPVAPVQRFVGLHLRATTAKTQKEQPYGRLRQETNEGEKALRRFVV